MTLIVQKYGGTSVGSVERIQTVAQHICKISNKDNKIVVVVSAMGKTTDTLVKLSQEIAPNPSRREMDMLLSTGEQVTIALMTMALQKLGKKAISLTGAQVGIVTEAEHSYARILSIKPDRIQRHLHQNEIVVVAGFQGISCIDSLEITTLGRGGSDTSAVALAASLKANCCEIYTDVPGILTTDPHLVQDAQLIKEITSDEMLELASLGAQVLHPRAVEIARNYGLPLIVRSSWSDNPGTLVTSPVPQSRSLNGLEITKAVDGIELDENQAKVALLKVPDRPGIAAHLLREIASQKVNVDLIIQSIYEKNGNDIAFTVVENSLGQAESVADAIASTFCTNSNYSEEVEVIVEKRVAKIAIAGAGMIGRPGIAAKMFKTLAEQNINIEMIATSEIKISCVIAQNDSYHAIQSLSKAFEIKASPTVNISPTISTIPPVRGVALDTKLVQIAIRRVKDKPGMAANIFGVLAKNNISVDTIIQSQRCRIFSGEPTRDMAFTVAQGNSELAYSVLKKLSDGFDEILIDENIAKVSIVGAGMAEKPGIAAQFFEALAAENINIKMIATSEIKISCVVTKDKGIQALNAVHSAFKLDR